MSSLRELIYSQGVSSQGSAFYTPKPQRAVPEADSRQPERIMGLVSSAAPCTRRSELPKRIKHQLPLYWHSPTVRAESKRARRELPLQSQFAPGVPCDYMFPQLDQRYNDIHREVLRQLWDRCVLSRDSNTALQVLQVLCRIDAIDVTDMASAMVLLTNTGRSGEVKRLAEGLYKLAKVPLQNTDKDQIIRVLVDYYALVEGDLSIARDLVEGQPALSAVSITLLIIRCVEMAQAISSASRAEAATASLYSIQAVVQNPVAFANVVLLLKECLVSAEYGVSARSSHRSQEDDSDSDSGFHGRNKRPHAQVVMTDTSLPAKREISSLLTSLGTALRSFMSRRVGRWAQVDSDLSSAGSASTDSSAPHAGAEVERREQSAGYSVDLHVMFACYLHGSGDPKQGLLEIEKMVQTNNHLARAHMLHLRYLCCHYGLRGKSGISAAVNQWAASAPGCFEAVYLALLSLRANIEAETRRCSCEHCVVAEEHHADYIAAHSLITSWATWKALAFLLGPLPKVVTPRRGNSKIYISMNSEYNNVISQYLVTDIHRKRSKCLAHGVVLPTAERPRGSICADSLQSYFQSSRLWWKQTMLHPHMFPFREISDEEPFLQRVKEKMVHQSSLPEISSIWTSLNWLSLLSQRIHDESDFSKIVSIETFGHNDKCSCQQVLLDKTCVHKVDSDGDVPCNFLLVELLCFQIIVSCHLHGGCQDNMFCVLGINHLLDLCRSTASTAEQVSDIFLVVQLLSSMRIDAARAAKLGALLPKLGISRNKLTSGE